jgi:hypothetical protein
MRSSGRYAPALAVMGVIFLLSAQSGLPRVESDLGVVLSKAVHMAEYALLWTLWVRALAGPPPRAAVGALAISLAYAISDELHQGFVAGRHSSPFDVAVDAAGMGVAAAVWAARARRARGPGG